MLDQIEPSSGQTIVDDLKMVLAVTIAAAVMIPAILTYSFIAWLVRSSTRKSLRANGTAGPYTSLR